MKKGGNKAGMKECRRTTDICKNTQQMLGSLLAFFHLCLASALFSAPSLTEMKFQRNIFLNFRCFSGVTFRIEDERVYCVADEHYWRGKETRFALYSDERFIAGGANVFKTQVQTSAPSPHTPTRLATSDFRTKLISRWLLLARTHLRKRAVAITLSYSPSSSYATPTSQLYTQQRSRLD